jgi:hypothetical protein
MKRRHDNAAHRQRRPQCRRHRAGGAGAAGPEGRRARQAHSGRPARRAPRSGRAAPPAYPGASFTPHQIGKVLPWSAGVVARAMDKMASLGVTELANCVLIHADTWHFCHTV